MHKHHVKYLLIGGGVASSAAAEAIRGRDREGEVLLVAQESTRPYHRPPLSKEGAAEPAAAGVVLQSCAELVQRSRDRLADEPAGDAPGYARSRGDAG